MIKCRVVFELENAQVESYPFHRFNDNFIFSKHCMHESYEGFTKKKIPKHVGIYFKVFQSTISI